MKNQDPFSVDAIHEGGMATFDIIPSEDVLKVYYHDEFIAELENAQNWKQIAGENIPPHILNQITYGIEEYYKQQDQA